MWFKSAGSSTGGISLRRSAPSILSEGLRLDGDIVCSGEVHISGTLAGNISAGKLTVGEGGSIDGTVEAQSAVINGTLSGRLVAVDVVLGKSAHVTADIVYCSMRIEPGAMFEGYSRRVEREELPSIETTKQLLPSLRSLRNGAERHEMATPVEADD
jgi:cytoskeletal protein CcmA (bactofilin family)